MKKIYILAAVALVASAACTKIETPESTTPDVKIGYQVASYMSQTKAPDSHGHTSFIDELTEIGVSTKSFRSKAFIHAAQSDGNPAEPAPFFNAVANGIETISYDGTSKWEPAHTYYWPKSPKSSISFFSWYDMTGADPTVTYTTDGGTASLAWADRTVALKDNVLYADGAYHFKSNSGATHKLDGVTEGVPTLFRHALAKVRFTVKASQVEKADSKNSSYKTFWKVTLSDVALSSGTIKSNGKFTVSQTSAAPDAPATVVSTWTLPTDNIWTAPATQAYLTANLGNASGDIFDTDVAKGTKALTTTAVTLTGTNFMRNNYFTVMPQTVADGVTLTFKYTVETRYGNDKFDNATPVSTEVINVNDLAAPGTVYTATGIQLNAIGDTHITKWQMNHQYVYNIVINPETATILYDPAVETWNAEESASVTVPNA